MKRIILKPGEERRIQRGHPWVYRSEIEAVLAGPAKAGTPDSAKAGTPDSAKAGILSSAKAKTLDSGGGTTADLEPGECADVESSPFYPDGTKRPHPQFLGRAIVNPESQIVARIYSSSKEGLDKGFFKRRIREALELGSGRGLSRDSFRMVFAEADFLPGLIVDRFVGLPASAVKTGSAGAAWNAATGAAGNAPDETSGNGNPAFRSWLSVQFLARGMDLRKEMILDALEEVLSSPLRPGREALGKPDGIIEKSAPVRELEGLPLYDGLVRGEFPEEGAVIAENGLLFHADLIGGQKTGHFLDQKDNRRRTAEYLLAAVSAAPSERPFRILDCFCYTGAFAVYAAKAAASLSCPVQITAVDVSAAALNLVQKNAALNGAAGEIECVEADAFDFLSKACRQREQYDLIILDPPAFAKNRAALENALRGYKEINLKALKLLAKGGLLVTCSCSHAVDENRFKQMIVGAAADAEKRIVQADFRYQGADHPILVGYDESLYLKCGFYRVVG